MVTVGKSVIHGSDSWGYGKGMYLNTWGDARNTEDVTARSQYPDPSSKRSTYPWPTGSRKIIFRGATFKGDTGFVVSSLGGYYPKKHMTSKFTTIFSRWLELRNKKARYSDPFHHIYSLMCFLPAKNAKSQFFRAKPKKNSARAWEESSHARYRFS